MKRCKICKKVLGFCIAIDKNGQERGTCDKCNLEKCFDKMAEEEKEAEDLKKQNIIREVIHRQQQRNRIKQLRDGHLMRENIRRKTVLINRIQDLLDGHYEWENENGIDDD